MKTDPNRGQTDTGVLQISLLKMYKKYTRMTVPTDCPI
jgi:hypothetical protein